MTRNEMIEALAEYFGAELKEKDNGEYDITGYDWEAGCYMGVENSWGENEWLSLRNVVFALEDLCEEDDENWDLDED